MGSSQSSASIRKISNDFELVIRATKELEFMLETEFDAPTGKTIGLHEKISDVEHSFGLSRPTVQKMRYLVTVRNKLVHDPKFNELENRVEFAKSFDSVIEELKAKRKAKINPAEESCVVM